MSDKSSHDFQPLIVPHVKRLSVDGSAAGNRRAEPHVVFRPVVALDVFLSGAGRDIIFTQTEQIYWIEINTVCGYWRCISSEPFEFSSQLARKSPRSLGFLIRNAQKFENEPRLKYFSYYTG